MKIHLRIGDFEVSTIALTLLVIGFLCFWVFSIYERPIVNEDSDNKKVVIFGDSLARGVGSLQNGGIAGVLSKELGQDVINMGVSGDTTSTAWERIEDVTDLHPGVVIIVLGGNDYFKKTPERDVESRYKRIITELHESGSAVIILGLPFYSSMYRSLSNQYETGYVPNIMSGIITRPDYMFDSVHPNDAGYEKIAQKIKPKLVHILQD